MSFSLYWRAPCFRISPVADALERIVVLPETPPLQADGMEGGNGRELMCTVWGEGGSPDDPTGTAIQWRRYRWGDQVDPGRLLMQTRLFAGSKELTASAQDQELPADRQWDRIEPVVIAEGLDQIQLHFRPRYDANARWRQDWGGVNEPVLARVRVRASGTTAERFVTPRVSSPLIDNGSGGGG